MRSSLGSLAKTHHHSPHLDMVGMEISRLQMVVARLVIDFGFVILSTLVQFIIYPSFLYMKGEALLKWHTKYVKLINFFVAPLMFIQTGLVVYDLCLSGMDYILDLAFLLGVWINTFFIAIPLHRKIDENDQLMKSVHRLIAVNRSRTAFWIMLFALSFYRILGI